MLCVLNLSLLRAVDRSSRSDTSRDVRPIELLGRAEFSPVITSAGYSDHDRARTRLLLARTAGRAMNLDQDEPP